MSEKTTAARIAKLTKESSAVELAVTVIQQERKIEKLTAALVECYAVIAHVRYQEWPTLGLGIGLSPEVLDEVMRVASSTIASTFMGVIAARMDELAEAATRKRHSDAN